MTSIVTVAGELDLPQVTGMRVARLTTLIADAHALLDQAIASEITSQRRDVAGIAALFSGGNDSTTLAHLFRDRLTHAVHCNTGIGVEQTREFVRDVVSGWSVPLLEQHVMLNDSYETMVMGECRALSGPRQGRIVFAGGFPGPGAHARMYQRLKGRSIERAQATLVGDPFRRRVIFLTGRRGGESARRAARVEAEEIRPVERKGSAVFVSPLLNWTALDLNTYRMTHPEMPHNEISDLMHQSCECECGAFAHENELEELDGWTATRACADQIRRLQKQVAATGRFRPQVCRWGWGWNKSRPPVRGVLCSNCAGQGALFDEAGQVTAL